MPLTPEQKKKFQDLAAELNLETDRDEVLQIVQTNFHPVFQEINDRGRTAANQANAPKLKAAEDKAKAIEEQLKAAQDSLKALEGKTPEVTELRTKFQKDIDKLEADHKTALEAVQSQLRREREERAELDLVSELEDQLIDKEYAKTVLVKRADVKKRLRYNDDGTVSVLKNGSEEATIVPADDKSPLFYLAQELAPNVPAKFKTSKVRRGAGTKGSAGGPADGNNTVFDNIRKQEENRDKREGIADPTAGLQRLQGSRAIASER